MAFIEEHPRQPFGYLILFHEARDPLDRQVAIRGTIWSLEAVHLGPAAKDLEYAHMDRHVSETLLGHSYISKHALLDRERMRIAQELLCSAPPAGNAYCELVPRQDGLRLDAHLRQERNLDAWAQKWGLE